MPKKDTEPDVTVDVDEDPTDGQDLDDAADDASGDGDGSQDDQDDATQTDGDGAQAQGGKPGAKRAPRSNRPTTSTTTDPDDPAAGLKKALASERLRAKGLDKELRDLRLKTASAEERALLEAREQGAAEAASATREPLVRALAASGLRAAGVQTGIEKLVGLLDLNKVTLDEDSEVVGLDEQIDELKDTFPGLFAVATGTTTRVPNANGGAGSKTGRSKDREGQQAPKGFAQILADQVTGVGPLGTGMVGR